MLISNMATSKDYLGISSKQSMHFKFYMKLFKVCTFSIGLSHGYLKPGAESQSWNQNKIYGLMVKCWIWS